MKELDLLLERYMQRCWESADASEQAAFERLLELEDPELYMLLSGKASAADSELQNAATKIRNAADH